MSTVHVGSTRKFAEGWEGIFGGQGAKAKPKRAALATAATPSTTKKAANKIPKNAPKTPRPNAVPTPKTTPARAAKPAPEIKPPKAKGKAANAAQSEKAKTRKPALLQRELF